MRVNNTIYILITFSFLATFILPAHAKEKISPPFLLDTADSVVKNFLSSNNNKDSGLHEFAKSQGSVIADLDDDGKSEIILVWTTMGPTYWHNTLTIFTQIAEQYTPVSSLPLNGEAKLSSVKDSIIFINQTMYAKKDPLCCPTIKRQMKYQWAQEKLSQLK